MFKKRRYIILSALFIYIILLLIIVFSESAADNSNIHGIGDAIWYSVVTLTTVGYGDSYPVSLGGRIAGTILVFASLGLFSAIITKMVSSLTSYALPLSKLRHYSSCHWNIFLSDTESSVIMAEELISDDPDCISIFFKTGDHRAVSGEEDDNRIFYVKGSLRWLISLHRGITKLNIFCFGPDGWENYKLGRKIIYDYRIPVYCLTELKSDQQIPNFRLFDPVEGLGRFYWSNFPVKCNEKSFIIVGCHDVGSSLLQRGLQTNIFQPDRGIHYIVAGDSSDFKKIHYRLVNETDLSPDQLTFCDSLWDIPPELIYNVDRIIFCHDKESDNLSEYQTLVTHYPVHGQIHVYTSTILHRNNTKNFGNLRDIYTPALVVQDKRSEMAKQMHNLYRKKAIKNITDWKGLTEFQKQSNIAAADHILVKCRILLGDKIYDHYMAYRGIETVLSSAAKIYQEKNKDPDSKRLFRMIEHNRWTRFEIINNWSYNPKYDKEKRWNPMLVPYDELPESVLEKDDNAWELIGEALTETE